MSNTPPFKLKSLDELDQEFTVSKTPHDAPKPVKTEAKKPKVVRSEVLMHELLKPKTTKPVTEKPGAVVAESVKPDIVRPEPEKPVFTRPDTAIPEMTRPEMTKPVKPAVGLKKKSKIHMITTVLLYIVSIAVLLGSLMFFIGTSQWAPNILGYSIRSVYIASPQGDGFGNTFVIIRNIGPEAINLNDEVAFLWEDGSIGVEVVTGVYDGYTEDEIEFKISKLEDPTQVLGMIPGDVVVGRVVLRSETLGSVTTFFAETTVGSTVLVVMIILAALTACVIIAMNLFPSAKQVSRERRTIFEYYIDKR